MIDQGLHAVAITLLGSMLLAPAASAISYGDYDDVANGGMVRFLDVRDVDGLYGAPTVSLNSIDFTPSQFQAACSVCPGGVTTDDIISFDIQAVAGQQISEITINEGLDYSVLAFGGGAFASALVNATLFIDITEVDGQAINGINANAPASFSPSNNVSVFGPSGTASGVIIGSLTLDLQQILADNGLQGSEATRVTVSLDNTLQAFHDGGGSASIRKRDTDFVSLTIVGDSTVVPEPSTALLLGAGLAALAMHRRGVA